MELNTVFHLACMKNYTGIAELLIEKSNELNIDLNAKNKEGQTALHVAFKYGRLKIICE